MIHNITIDNYVNDPGLPLIDVRSPGEFAHGHIPGAINIPLFSNEERKQVGTSYKQHGREQAILLGLDLAGPKWSDFIRQCLAVASDKKLVLHCWRGGMRSGAMAWVLDLYGFEVMLVRGGYKQYRRWVHEQFEKKYRLCVLGGMTGSGKTRILKQMVSQGIQIIDLEDLAQHQGSSYGTMNKMHPPTQQQFENNLAQQLKDKELQKDLWVEDECQKIGKMGIPFPFWNRMREAPLIVLNVPLEQRINSLVQEYGPLDKDFLVECTVRIKKRVGPEQTKHAVAAIRENRMADFIRIVLAYYDKTYLRGVNKRKPGQVFPLEITGSDISKDTTQLITFCKKILPQAEKIIH